MDGESISGLLCEESETFLEEEVLDEDTFISMTQSYSDLDREEEYVEMLVDTETSFGFKRDESLVFDSWVKCARAEAITWTLKTRAMFGFRFQTAYLSMIYFDRFLSRRSIDGEKLWAVKLLSVACLSLAAKMEEIKTPALSEFQIEECNFESKIIQKMELLVLNTLQWKMMSITPFSFIHYFIIKFCKDSPPRHIVSRTAEFILAVIKEINLMDHRPSVIAAAASLMALDQNLTRKALEYKTNSISNLQFLETEGVFQCYNVMQKLKEENLITPKVVNWQGHSPTHLRPMGFLDNSSVTSAICTKRKRLTFNSPDCNYGLPDDKRL